MDLRRGYWCFSLVASLNNLAPNLKLREICGNAESSKGGGKRADRRRRRGDFVDSQAECRDPGDMFALPPPRLGHVAALVPNAAFVRKATRLRRVGAAGRVSTD